MKGGLKQEFEAFVIVVGKFHKKYYSENIDIKDIIVTDIKNAKMFNTKEKAEKVISESNFFNIHDKIIYEIKKIKVLIQEISMLKGDK